MKKIYILLLAALSSSQVISQNLVINGGLDGYMTCPGFGQFSNAYIISWDKPSIASSDYYNFNCPGIQPTIQAPHSGEGYAGIICYNFGTEYREYITGTFSAPLIAGTTYNVEYWVSLHNGYIQAIEEVGAYISAASPGPFGNVFHINAVPQVENVSGALNDTANWKRVYGQYLATGGEQFITIGNFHDDAGTTITQPGTSGSFGAYYFIDDVSVMADSTTSMQDAPMQYQPEILVIQGNMLQIKTPQDGKWGKLSKLYCYNAAGSLVMESNINNKVAQFDLSRQDTGIYFVVLENNMGEKFSGKILISCSRN